MPPMPLDRATPIRALSSRSRSRPLWAMASAAAVTANWAKRSIRRISFFSSTPEGSKLLHLAGQGHLLGGVCHRG